MDDKKTLMQFPCDFPLKIIGNHTVSFVDEIEIIVFKHFPQTAREKITHKKSEKSNFISITVNLYVQDQPTLDALYQELTNHPDIKMVL